MNDDDDDDDDHATTNEERRMTSFWTSSSLDRNRAAALLLKDLIFSLPQGKKNIALTLTREREREGERERVCVCVREREQKDNFCDNSLYPPFKRAFYLPALLSLADGDCRIHWQCECGCTTDAYVYRWPCMAVFQSERWDQLRDKRETENKRFHLFQNYPYSSRRYNFEERGLLRFIAKFYVKRYILRFKKRWLLR